MKSSNSFIALSIVILLIVLTSAALAADSGQKEKEALRLKTGHSEMIKYLSGDDTVSAYLAMPEGSGPFPALIVIHEWWGLNDWIKKDADDFADSGYAALAIDLYHGKSTSSPEEARELSASVPQERAATDLRSAFDYLRSRSEVSQKNIGVIGWCMGGGYALRAALNLKDLAACVICYGRLNKDPEALKQIECPVLGIFGEKDQNITPRDVKEFEDALNKAGVKNQIIIYPDANHAFMNPGNTKVYNQEAAKKAWAEIYSFLNNNLKEGQR